MTLLNLFLNSFLFMNTARVKRMGNHTCVISHHSGKTIKPFFFPFLNFLLMCILANATKVCPWISRHSMPGQLSLWLLFSSALERTHAKRDGSPSWLLFRKPDLLLSCLWPVCRRVTVTQVSECKIRENSCSTGQVFGKLQEFSMVYCVRWLLEYDNTQVSMKTPESLCCSFYICTQKMSRENVRTGLNFNSS